MGAGKSKSKKKDGVTPIRSSTMASSAPPMRTVEPDLVPHNKSNGVVDVPQAPKGGEEASSAPVAVEIKVRRATLHEDSSPCNVFQ